MQPDETAERAIYAGQDVNPEGILHQLDMSLENLERYINILESRLEPIISNFSSVERLSIPESEPPTALHAKIRRLDRLAMQIDAINGRIAL